MIVFLRIWWKNARWSPDLGVLLRMSSEKLVKTHFVFCFKKCELFEFLVCFCNFSEHLKAINQNKTRNSQQYSFKYQLEWKTTNISLMMRKSVFFSRLDFKTQQNDRSLKWSFLVLGSTQSLKWSIILVSTFCIRICFFLVIGPILRELCSIAKT